MKERIEQAIQALKGLPLTDAGHAGLDWFSFGPDRIVPDERTGGTRVVGEYSLHVQCTWRIVGPEGIIVASRDRNFPIGDPYREFPDSEWDTPGANRRGERLKALFLGWSNSSPIVEQVWADSVGSIRIGLSSGYALEVFPDDSLEGEHWRLFKPANDDPHFVITGQGIEDSV